MKSKKKWIIWTVVIVILTNIGTFVLSNLIPLYLPNGKVIIGSKEYDYISKYSKMFLIRNQLYKYYDGKINENDLINGSIKGMVSSLKDPYTVFMNEEEYKSFNAQTEGNYSGIGIQIDTKDDKIIVAKVFDKSPAKKAGILANDEIDKVNGVKVSGKDTTKAISLMKGKEGTEVTIELNRKDKGSYKVTVERAKVALPTVKGEIIENNVGYVKVDMFDEHTGDDFKKSLNNLKSKGMKSLIIDLRENPGGLLDQCIDMASNFIPKGKEIVSTVDKYKNKKSYNSKGGDFIGLPVTILVDGNTASASEVFLGAMKDYNLATVIGTKTFGKGVVQTILEIRDGTALKVTISKYYSPNGKNINHIGIKPDVEVKYPKELLNKTYNRSLDPQFKKALQTAKDKIK